MYRLIHKLSHFFKLNAGKVVTYKEDDFICVGFECSGCGILDPDIISKIPISHMFEIDAKLEIDPFVNN